MLISFYGIEINEFPVRIAETAFMDDGPPYEQPTEHGVWRRFYANSN